MSESRSSKKRATKIRAEKDRTSSAAGPQGPELEDAYYFAKIGEPYGLAFQLSLESAGPLEGGASQESDLSLRIQVYTVSVLNGVPIPKLLGAEDVEYPQEPVPVSADSYLEADFDITVKNPRLAGTTLAVVGTLPDPRFFGVIAVAVESKEAPAGAPLAFVDAKGGSKRVKTPIGGGKKKKKKP